MLRFRDLLQFPAFYSKRNKNIRQVSITLGNIDKQDEYIEITGVSKDYKPTIRIFGTIENNSGVLISCNCQSFTYEFSHAVFRENSLLNPQTFGANLNTKPLEKNKYLISSGCKHIIGLANLILKEKNKIV